MIKATLDGKTITLTCDPADAPEITRIRAAARTAKMPPLTWTMPLTFGAVDELRKHKVYVSQALAAECRRLTRVKHYVEQVKLAGTVQPIAPVPVKAGIKLYNHQVKAYNIALALMGYDLEEQTS